MEEKWSTENKARLEDAAHERATQDLTEGSIGESARDENDEIREKLRREIAYHEAGHAVFHIMQGTTVHYVSIWADGPDYRGSCRSDIRCIVTPDGYVVLPWQALDRAVATLAGDIAMWKQAGETYPWGSWEELIEQIEELEGRDDSDESEIKDLTNIRYFCKTGADFGQFLEINSRDDLPEEMDSALPPSTPEEAFEQALSAAEQRVDLSWPAIEKVAERLMEVGRLSGDEVEEIVMNSGLFEQAG